VPLGGQSFTGIKLDLAIDIVKRGGVEWKNYILMKKKK
jgi:hypothetical protein